MGGVFFGWGVLVRDGVRDGERRSFNVLILFCYDFIYFFLRLVREVGNGSKRELPQVGKVSVFKPRVDNL